MKIKIFRLNNGLELITYVKDNDEWEHPMYITSQPAKDEKASVSLVPVLMFANNSTCRPNSSHVFLSYDPIDTVQKLYEGTVNAYRMQKSGLIHPSQANVKDLKGAAAGIERGMQ